MWVSRSLLCNRILIAYNLHSGTRRKPPRAEGKMIMAVSAFLAPVVSDVFTSIRVTVPQGDLQ